jgi:hypothetical protein
MSEEKKVVKTYFTAAEMILEAKDLKETDVHVPEWRDMGAEWVVIREMTAYDRDWIEGSMLADAQSSEVTLKSGSGRDVAAENFRSKVVALSVIHPETKERLFTTNQVFDLSKKSATAIARIADAAIELNAMSRKEVERLGEEYARVQAASSTDSPEASESPSENSTESSGQES